MGRFAVLLALSLAVAAALYVDSFDSVFKWLEPRLSLSFTAALLYMFLLPLLWLALVVLGLRLHGRRELWMLLGAPLAFYRPFMFVLDPDFP